MDDIAVDRTGDNILSIVRKAKGDQRRTAADKSLLQLPITAVPLLADLLEAFTARRTSYCNQLGNGPGPTAFRAVTPDDQPHTWTAGTITEWIREGCNTIGASPPTQFKWTLHSLRKGAAYCMHRRTPHQDPLHGWLVENQRRRHWQVHRPHHERNPGGLAILRLASRQTPG
jgi:hypothetical protein